jgi:hypothetical protein
MTATDELARRVRDLWAGDTEPEAQHRWRPAMSVLTEDVVEEIEFDLLSYVLPTTGAVPVDGLVATYMDHCGGPGSCGVVEQVLDQLIAGGDVGTSTDSSIEGVSVAVIDADPARPPSVRISPAPELAMEQCAPAHLVLEACSINQLAGYELDAEGVARTHLAVRGIDRPTGAERQLALGAAVASQRILASASKRRCLVCDMRTGVELDGWSVTRYPCVVCGDNGATGRPMWMNAARRSLQEWRQTFARIGAISSALVHCTRPPLSFEFPSGE